jgi:hypothetical protein
MDVTQIIAKGICTIPHLKLLGNTAYHVYVIMFDIIIMIYDMIYCLIRIYVVIHDNH